MIASCLTKDPASRPPKTEALRKRLLACDVEPWLQEDARAWWDQHLEDLGAVPADVADPDATTRTAVRPVILEG